MDFGRGASAVTDMTALLVTIMLLIVLIAASIARRPVGRCSPSRSDGLVMTRSRSVLEVPGRWVRSALRQPENADLDRVVGRALVVTVCMAYIHVGVAAMVPFVIWGRSMLRRRTNTRHEEARVNAGLADVIDLFAVALLSGNTVAEAISQVCVWSEGEFADAFAWCNRRVATGRPLSDVLESVPERLGPKTRPLIAALVSTERYGAPIAGNLAQLAAETRAERRRYAEASARRLPVELLFPLVFCVLPAFLLVTVVPVIAETIAHLDVASP